MARKKHKKKGYDVSGTVEVINVTKGRRKVSLLNLNLREPAQNIEISGSIVEKSPIYKQDVPKDGQKENLHTSGSIDEGQNPLYSL
jgi:hypothetical protein|tara:strand:- start:86 stop:343 length:258 start_codon:yes stop_codon:yes gene_type:complete